MVGPEIIGLNLTKKEITEGKFAEWAKTFVTFYVCGADIEWPAAKPVTQQRTEPQIQRPT